MSIVKITGNYRKSSVDGWWEQKPVQSALKEDWEERKWKAGHINASVKDFFFFYRKKERDEMVAKKGSVIKNFSFLWLK